MFKNQNTLPQLPVPSLENTLNLFLKSIRPLCDNTTQHELERLVDNFKSNLGPQLQQRLLEHKAKEEGLGFNWLERWWLEYAYHRYREPTLVNVNWFCLGKAKDGVKLNFKPNLEGGYSKGQIERAARLIDGMLEYKERVDKGLFPAEYVGKSPICMDQYKKLFGIQRIPVLECDIVTQVFPSYARHIIVLVKNHIYKVPVYQSVTGDRVGVRDIEKQLYSVIEDVVKQSKSKGICLLTAGHRDTWAKAYKQLQVDDIENISTLTQIHESLFAVSLDDHLTTDLNSQHKNIFHGFNGSNRWFDAILSLIVDPTGTAGLNGEHSPLDALIPASVLEFAIEREDKIEITSKGAEIAPVKRLKFKVGEQVNHLIEVAKVTINETIQNSDSVVTEFNDYGTDFIKKNAKCSPDAYIQMALQLAYFNLHKKVVSTYETGSTRKFNHGRTDAIRVLSSESSQFCKGMNDSTIDANSKYKLLQEAVQAHLNYANLVSKGEGIDRHLLGLKLCLQKGESHPLFDHPVFKASQSWTLSTSTMLKTDLIGGTGFGCVDPDGYGINYIPCKNGKSIIFGIESKHNSKISDTRQFRNSLFSALNQMKQVVSEIDWLKMDGMKAKI